jgi:endoglucanase
MKKKSLAIISMAVLLITGCSKDTNNNSQNGGSVTLSPSSVQQEGVITKVPEEEVSEGAAIEDLTINKISSIDFVRELKLGWNLGNTLDAIGGMGVTSENAWGNPITTKEMVLAVKDAGFNVIRFPVTWDGHVTVDGNFTIHDKWLERVKEVVDYAYEEDMYVVLNMHHEDWLYPSYENQEVAAKQLVAIWTQIANCFKDYDEHLIFEGMNEPRLKGTANEWNGGNQEGWDVVNYWDQAFVDAIRATGGNNQYRQLMVPGYAASSSLNALNAIKLPEDEYLILSVHAYLPYLMALDGGTTSAFDASNTSDTRDIDSLMTNLDELFISKGIPAIIGEFGSRSKENTQDRIELAEYYVKAAHTYNIPCIWWDNGEFNGNGENFGLYNRRANQWIYPEIVEALLKGIQ